MLWYRDRSDRAWELTSKLVTLTELDLAELRGVHLSGGCDDAEREPPSLPHFAEPLPERILVGHRTFRPRPSRHGGSYGKNRGRGQGDSRTGGSAAA